MNIFKKLYLIIVFTLTMRLVDNKHYFYLCLIVKRIETYTPFTIARKYLITHTPSNKLFPEIYNHRRFKRGYVWWDIPYTIQLDDPAYPLIIDEIIKQKVKYLELLIQHVKKS